MTVEYPIPNQFVFPQDQPNGILEDKFQRFGGLEMRDYFAANFLRGGKCLPGYESKEVTPDLIAEQCFVMADAMMKARKQGVPDEA